MLASQSSLVISGGPLLQLVQWFTGRGPAHFSRRSPFLVHRSVDTNRESVG